MLEAFLDLGREIVGVFLWNDLLVGNGLDGGVCTALV